MSGSSDGTLSSQPAANGPVRFNFTRGAGGSTLSINFVDRPGSGKPDANASAAPPPDIDFSNPMMMNMLKTMFQGFKVGVDLEVEGKIVKTNADYVNGSRVTLLEIEMAGLFEDEAKLKALQSKIGPGATISEIKPYLKDVKGVKINHPTISIEYR